MNEIAHESFHAVMAAQVESGAMPGLVALGAHGGAVGAVMPARGCGSGAGRRMRSVSPLCRA